MEAVRETHIPELPNVRRGKVRDIYELDDTLLIVATDRISAFDVVMNEAIPGKGIILNAITLFWLDKTKEIIPNHLISSNVDDYPEFLHKYRKQLEGRSMLVKKCDVLPVEFIVRGYLAGSGWKEYKKSQTVCSIPLPDGLVEFSRLPKPLFTPSTKAEVGHDENINLAQAAEILGKELAEKLSEVAIALYQFGADYLEAHDLILADTKFEFGRNADGSIVLIDEALTPDSSRFWLKEHYAPGKSQIQFDKQTLRDYLESLDWNKQPPPPTLPQHIIEKIIEVYNEALRRITS